MILSQVIDHYPSLKLQDSLSRAQKLFEQFQISILAVVEKGQFKGILTQQNLQNHYPEQKISEIASELAKDALVGENDIFSSLPLFEKYNEKILPVVDEHDKFLGYLERDALAKEIILSDNNLEEGGIIKLQFHQQRDSMSQIFRILEENKALVIKSFLKDGQNDNQLPTLIIHVKTQQLGILVQHLERHGYVIENSFQLIGTNNFDHSRFESLMKYLTI